MIYYIYNMVQFTKEVLESYILRETFYPKSISINTYKKKDH